MNFHAQYAGKMDIHLCPRCLKKGIETYIPVDQQYCSYCKKAVEEEQAKIKYPIGGPWYLGESNNKSMSKGKNPWYL